MSIEFVSPVGRLVQGSLTLEAKTDMLTQKPKLDDNGNPIKECFIALAIRKDDPGLPAFHANFVAAAKADFPHLFDANGACTHPKFAWKIQDGDGRDTNGESVANKPGHAGHYIFKMATRYLPKCFHHGKYDPAQQIQNAQEIIKRGYFIRVVGTIRGNGVTPAEKQAVPGLFVSPNLVELVAFGEEIVSGPDAAKAFGSAPAIGALPAGASTVPSVGSSAPAGLTAPPAPGLALPAAAPALALPAAAPALALPAAAPALPAIVAPAFIMQPSAMGATREALHAQGWTDALLLQHGHMIQA